MKDFFYFSEYLLPHAATTPLNLKFFWRGVLFKMRRTKYCGLFSEADIGKTVIACGWTATTRDMGGVIFLDLSDREGTLQIVLDAAKLPAEQFAIAEELRNQSVIEVEGVIRLRAEDTVNEKLSTGKIELFGTQLRLLSMAAPLPYPIEDGDSVREDLRLKYRYLDLRRHGLQENLKLRHRILRAARDFLDAAGFVEVETPMLTKSTPEGARDYLVPSRVHPGSFYALPQSPQIFKQLLMVGGMDRYYQVARCFRDEDLRADRQPEFTQVDMEMSFVEQEDVLVHLESLFKRIAKEVCGLDICEPFERITWTEAMDKYGSDKPDLRFDMPIVDITEIAANCSFTVFSSVAKKGGVVRAINVKNTEFTRSQIEELTKVATQNGAKGMAWIAVRQNGELYSVLTKYFKQEELDRIIQALDAEPGDFLIFSADKLANVRRVLGVLRLAAADMLSLRDPKRYKFLIVTDFPQFEYSEEEHRYIAMHHPFTMPYPEDIPYLESAPERVRAQAYDFVLNGVELGSGSVRIHDSAIQEKMFHALGFDKAQIEERFGFMVGAFRYGTPPHAGFAFGLDRLTMLLSGASSLRDVIAFPKIKDASCPMTDAPTPVDEEQLKALELLGQPAAQKARPAALKKSGTKIDVERTARLARLSLAQEEKEKMRAELEAMLQMADTLSEVDTEGIPAAALIGGAQNVFRPDEVRSAFTQEEMLREAPSASDGYITVPKTVQ